MSDWGSTAGCGLKAGRADSSYSKRANSPGFISGGLFFSLAEGATKLESIVPASGGSTRVYLANLEYFDSPSNNVRTKWHDRVYIIKENGRWVVNDLEFLAEFGSKRKLSDYLRQVIKEANEST